MVLGKPLNLTSGSYTIVGVAPADFGLPRDSEAWVTLAAIRPDAMEGEGYGTLDLVGRLRPGRTVEDARVELDRLVMEIDGSKWSTDSRLAITVRPLADVLVGEARAAILVLSGAALLVFLIAVINLGNLLVVRGLQRQRELAIRRAMGATRLSLALQIVAETAVLVGLGTGAGLGLAVLAWRVLPAVVPADLSRVDGISLNPTVLAVALGLSFLAVGLVSLLPALSLRDADLRLPRGGDQGAPGSRTHGLVWSGAIAAQVALAIVTTIGSLLLLRTLAHLQRLEPGFQTENLASLQIALLTTDSATVARGKELVAALTDRVRTWPGVEAVTRTIARPLSGTAGWDFGFIAEGQTVTDAAANPYLNYEAVTPSYFRTLRMPLLAGREFHRIGSGGERPGRDPEPIHRRADVARTASYRKTDPLGGRRFRGRMANGGRHRGRYPLPRLHGAAADRVRAGGATGIRYGKSARAHGTASRRHPARLASGGAAGATPTSIW